MSEELKKVMDKAWLNFFNNYFYEKGAITAYEKNKIENKIDSMYDKNSKGD